MTQDTTHRENRPEDGQIGLASLLNILWRRRWIVVGLPLLGMLAGVVYGIVVTPLYLGTATIRPGITAFDRNGGGAREWRLKDLTRWYESGLYRPWTAREMGVPVKDVPEVRADFIQRGLQNIQGGEVITLTCMDASPENAVRGLQASIDAFTVYALSDTMSNSIVLTRRGLEIQIDELRRQQSVHEARVDSLNADLNVGLIDSLRIDHQFTRLQSEILLAEARREALEERAEELEAQLGSLQERRSELASARERVQARVVSGPVGENDAEVFGVMASSGADLERLVARFRAEIDSVRQAARFTASEAEYFRQRNSTWAVLERARAARELDLTRSARDFGVPNAIRSLELRIREKQGQLAALSPIEKIGQVEVTPDPVRPRKSRAIMILTVFGLIGGVAGAFVFDYLWAHRREIFRG